MLSKRLYSAWPQWHAILEEARLQRQQKEQSLTEGCVPRDSRVAHVRMHLSGFIEWTKSERWTKSRLVENEVIKRRAEIAGRNLSWKSHVITSWSTQDVKNPVQGGWLQKFYLLTTKQDGKNIVRKKNQSTSFSYFKCYRSWIIDFRVSISLRI